MEGAGLNRGDEIDVRGRAFRLGNYRVLLAERVRVDRETVTAAEERQPSAGTQRSQARTWTEHIAASSCTSLHALALAGVSQIRIFSNECAFTGRTERESGRDFD